MKKFILLIILVITLFVVTYFVSNEKDNNKIKVAEVTHSIFYAPLYLADSNGYFNENNIDVEIILTSGADKVTAAVLSNDVDIGFCGSEATIYVYNQGEKDYLQTFAGLTKKDGSFLVSREKNDDFSINDLKDSYIIGGRKGGMPEMTLEWAIKQNGLDPKQDLEIDTSIEFASMFGAFISGTGDYVTLFEPLALEAEKNGYGHVVASIGEYGGIVPYTAFNARKSYIENNPGIIKGFIKSIQKGLDYVHNNSSSDIANCIKEYFPDTNIKDLTNIVERYKNIDAWYDNTNISEKDFNHIQEIMISAGELNSIAPYDKLVYKK